MASGPRFWQPSPMARTILLYALALAAGAGVLQWLEYRFLTRSYSVEIYVALVAAGFVALGIWIGRRLTPGPPAAREGFVRNDAAIRSLGLSPRECEILALLASGQSNKEMARTLAISPNTIKTHLARVYGKLEVARRVQAIEKARWLRLIP
ncbi:MAG TPA: helix-turn-helix transcriptional regulator [Allosphingosinicella sp.]|jgi:DNA-binding CsgD family transcriptional regulator